MKAQRNGLFRYIFIFVLVLVLIRFLPVLMRVGQVVAIGIRGYWWVVLPSLLIGLMIWRSKRRVLAAEKSENLSGARAARDVTNSVAGDSMRSTSKPN